MADGRSDDWAQTLADLEARRAAARAMGGAQRLQRHREAGKLDCRARLDLLLDPGSFEEVGTLVGELPADAFVAGSGTIEGRPVMVGAEDFTVAAGTIAAGNNAKRLRVAELALRLRLPLVMLLDGAGYRPGAEHGRAPTDLLLQARCSGRVPLVSAVLGSSAGHGALVAPVSDFTVMSRHAAIFVAGPPVVREVTGEEVTKEALGGQDVAVRSGLVHNVATDDEAALQQVRRYLSFFPSSAWSFAPLREGADGRRPVPELLDLVPRDGRQVYDMRPVVAALVDDGDWFEVQPGFGPAVLCGLARLAGEPVAVVANQPRVRAGAIDAEAADKAAHFVAVADSFHLPLLFLADNPGFLPGTASERAGVLRSGARLFRAQTQATTPKLHVTVRKAYGFGAMVMGMTPLDGQVASFTLPGSTLGAMGARATGSATKADDEQARLLQQAELDASLSAARQFTYDEVVDPRDLRNALLGVMGRLGSRREAPTAPVRRVGTCP